MQNDQVPGQTLDLQILRQSLQGQIAGVDTRRNNLVGFHTTFPLDQTFSPSDRDPMSVQVNV